MIRMIIDGILECLFLISLLSLTVMMTLAYGV
jgi:hypothetical protein